MRPYYVAIVGSGPSGYFAAASLLKLADAAEPIDVHVDMLEMLPTPWGLVRSGVAPDHPKIKSISAQFEKTALHPRFRFFGNIAVGEARARRRTRRALRRGDLRRRRAGRQAAADPGRGPARLCGGHGAGRLVQRASALRDDAAGPDRRAGDRRRQRQRGAGRGPHPGHRPRRAAHHRHRRPRAGAPGPARRGGSDDHRPARPAAGHVHHLGAARARRPQGARRRRRPRRSRRTWPTSPTRTPRLRARPSRTTSRCCASSPRTQPTPGNRRIVFKFRTSPIEIRGDGRVQEVVLGRNELVADESGRLAARTPASARCCPRSWSCARSDIAECRHPVCRSTTGPARFRTPRAGSTAAATSTSSAGSSAARRE